MKNVFTLLCLFCCSPSWALSESAFEAPDNLRQIAKEFLVSQSTGHPGQVKIAIGKIDNRLKLPACANIQAFLLPGNKPWGKISLGMRCSAPKAWSIYVTAHIQVTADYFVTATPLLQGQIIGPNDILKISGDLTTLPIGVITNPAQAIGKSLLMSLASGSALRMDALKTTPVIQQGQTIKVVSAGQGFQVTTDALALSNANEGQVARAKTSAGQLVSGIARTGGIIGISF